jgi:predicted outer membrane repeat protein
VISTYRSTRARVLALAAIAFLLAAALAMFTAQRPAYADTACVVNSLLDTDSSDGAQCQTTASSGITTLRSAFHRDVVAGGTNTITFASTLSLPSTITLGNGVFDLTGGNLTIIGPGARRLSIDAANNSRIFAVRTGATLHVADLTLTNADSTGQTPNFGGAIFALGTLTLDGMTLSHNHSPTFGGAVWNSTPTVTVANSTFTNNVATSGGGGAISGDGVTITNVTATGNTAGWGGAFHADHGDVTILNSTIVANQSTDLDLHGGGVFGSSTVHLKNTIVAGNLQNSTPNQCAGNIGDDGYNLDSGTTCGFANHALNSTDPLVKALSNNGGPTDTMALQSASPARDSAGPGCPTLDQRGQPREAICDRGAYEFAQPAVGSVAAANTSCVTPGQSVTINGSGFTFATAVKFGSTPATSFVVNSDTKITAVAPAGSGAVHITVTNADGTSATVTNDQVTLGACPAVPTLPKAGAVADQAQLGGLIALLVILATCALGVAASGWVLTEARRRD